MGLFLYLEIYSALIIGGGTSNRQLRSVARKRTAPFITPVVDVKTDRGLLVVYEEVIIRFTIGESSNRKKYKSKSSLIKYPKCYYRQVTTIMLSPNIF